MLQGFRRTITLQRSLARKSLAVLLCACATFSGGIRASEIITDRPDQTESSVAVNSGVTQIEFGWSHSYQESGASSERVNEFPESLVRIGLRPGLELRLGWGGYASKNPGVGSEDSFEGANDMSVGVKINLWQERGSKPQAALLIDATIPIGHSSFTSDHVDPSARVSFSSSLSERLSLGYNVGVTSSTSFTPAGVTETAVSGLYTVALGVDVIERYGAFVELFGEKRIDMDEAPIHAVDGGVTRLFGKNIQLDVAVGLGLSNGSPDWFITSGLSIRMPK
jgi:Putative MetA-pathway of phenol degradation